MQNINLTPIIQALITLFAALITYRLIPWIKSKTSNEQQAAMRAMVKTLVFAAEQLYGEMEGSKKLDYVKTRLLAAGYDVDVAEIEAAVYEYLNQIPMSVTCAVDEEYAPPDEETEKDA